LVSTLAYEKPVSYRIAVAMYANGIMAVSKHLQKMLGSLRDEIADVGERIGGAGVDLPEGRGDERLGRESPKKYNVYLILDDWTHGRLRRVYANAPDYDAMRGGDMVMVRDLLRMAMGDIEKHIPVLREYLVAIDRLEERVGEAVEGERRALVEALAAV